MKTPRKVFLGWEHFLLPQTAAWLLEEYGPNLAELTLVMPGRRAGRRLVEILAQTAPTYWTPPNFLTLAQLSDQQCKWVLPRADDPLRMFAWIAALQALPTSVLARLLSSPPATKDLESWWPLAETLRALHAELAAENFHFGQVLAHVDEGEVRRWETLAKLQQRYLKILQDAGFSDPHWVRLQALAEKRLRPLPNPLILVGLPEANALQREFLRQLEADCTALIAAPEELASAFDEFGFVLADAWADRPLAISSAQVHRCANPKHQAQKVVAFLQKHAGKFAAEDITLGVLDNTSLLPLEVAFRGHAVSIHKPTGKEAIRTSLAQLLQALAAWLEQPDAENFSTLLGHPDLADYFQQIHHLDFHPEAFDEYAACHLPQRLGKPWLDPPVDQQKDKHHLLRRQFQSFWQHTESLRQRAQVAKQWAPILLAWLETVYAHRVLDTSKEGQRELQWVLEKSTSILQAWQELPEDGPLAFFLTAAQALRLWWRELQGMTIPPRGSQVASLDAVDWLELPLDDAHVLCFTDFQEGLAPAALSASPLLGPALRQRLGLYTEEQRWARDRFLLEMMVQARKQPLAPQFFVCHADADGSPRKPSRFLFLDQSTLVQRACQLFSTESPNQEQPNFDLPPAMEMPGPREGLKHNTEVFSCSRINRYLDSPYSYYLQYVLSLNGKEGLARELDPLQFGILLHAVLEQFGKQKEFHNLDEEVDIFSALKEILHQESKRRFGPQPQPVVPLQVVQAEQRLKCFATEQARRRQQGWTIFAAEWRPPGKKVPLAFGQTSFSLEGRIDRIDLRETSQGKEWCIIDYKSGDKAKNLKSCWQSRNKRWLDIQLALYPYLCRSLTGGRGPAFVDGLVSAAYWNLSGDPRLHGLDLVLLEGEEMRTALEEQVAAAVEGIRRNDFFRPDQPLLHRSTLAARCMGDGFLAIKEPLGDADEEEGA